MTGKPVGTRVPAKESRRTGAMEIALSLVVACAFVAATMRERRAAPSPVRTRATATSQPAERTVGLDSGGRTTVVALAVGQAIRVRRSEGFVEAVVRSPGGAETAVLVAEAGTRVKATLPGGEQLWLEPGTELPWHRLPRERRASVRK